MSEESLLSSAPEATATEAAVEDSAPAIERPEWLLDKYVSDDRELADSIAEQAKAYTEAQKRLGGFTGAPEDDYTFAMPEGIEGELDTELDAYQQFTQVAREVNMNQETAQKLFNIFVGYQDQMNKQFAIDFNTEKESLGPQADQRIGAVASWAQSNLAPEDMPVLESMLMRADQMAVMEKLIGKTRNSPVPKTNQVDAPVAGYTEHQFHQDVNSDRYRTDRSFREAVRKKAQGLYPGA